MLKLDGRQAWHFPQNQNGVYAGYHPVDSMAAISHLEALRARGGAFLLFPGTAFWWFDHYKEFHQHLDRRYQRIWGNEHCVIYQLSAPQPGAGAQADKKGVLDPCPK
jgi:hypothetical protein